MTGTVTNDKGKPVKEYTVVVFARGRRRSGRCRPAAGRPRRGPISRAQFKFTDLPPGAYLADRGRVRRRRATGMDPEWLARAARRRHRSSRSTRAPTQDRSTLEAVRRRNCKNRKNSSAINHDPDANSSKMAPCFEHSPSARRVRRLVRAEPAASPPKAAVRQEDPQTIQVAGARWRADPDAASRTAGQDRHRPPARPRRRDRHGERRAPRAGAHQRARHRHQDRADRRAGALRVPRPPRRPLQRQRLQVRLRDDAVRPEPSVRAGTADRAGRGAGDGQGRRLAAARQRARRPRRRRVRRSGRRSRSHGDAHAVPERQAAAGAVGPQRRRPTISASSASTACRRASTTSARRCAT